MSDKRTATAQAARPRAGKRRRTPQSAPEFVGIEDAAHLLGQSRSRIYDWLAAGRFPRPSYLAGRRKFWHRPELIEWAKAGAPPTDEWDVIRGRVL